MNKNVSTVLAIQAFFFTMNTELNAMIKITLDGEQKVGIENKLYLSATDNDGLSGYLGYYSSTEEWRVIYDTKCST